jgi:hypothetical protein
VLDISSCGITDRAIHYISKYLTNLRVLRLAWCKDISDNGLLGKVDINDPRLGKIEDEGMCRCTRKRQAPVILSLPKKENAALTNDPSAEACNYKLHIQMHQKETWPPVTNIRTLVCLDVTACHRVTDTSITQLMTFPELTAIHLGLCKGITDASLLAIAEGIPCMEEIHLTQCKAVSTAGITALAEKLRRLRYLDISNCDAVTNQALEALAKHSKRLRHLDISLCNNITCEMVEKLENSMMHLQTVRKRLMGGGCFLHDVCSHSNH